MRILASLTFTFILALAAGPALAQQAQMLTDEALHEAVVDGAAAEEAQRALIRSLLQRDDVRALAAEHGLDVVRAENAVGTLSGPELARLAPYAAQAHTSLAGAQDRIVISATTLIIVLLLIILILILA
ncbi:MAG: hypothetical protein R3247_04440 [Rhodothermales bacterium]|nr:hypothetical protein [Rhodothermales bacterium]